MSEQDLRYMGTQSPETAMNEAAAAARRELDQPGSGSDPLGLRLESAAEHGLTDGLSRSAWAAVSFVEDRPLASVLAAAGVGAALMGLALALVRS